MTIDLRLERETEYAEFSPGAAILNLGLHLPHDIGRVVKDLIAISDDKDLIIYDTDGKEVASQDIGTSIKELTFTGFTRQYLPLDGYLLGLTDNKTIEIIRLIIDLHPDEIEFNKIEDLRFRISMHRNYTLDDNPEHIINGMNRIIWPLYASTQDALHAFSEKEMDRMNGMNLQFNNKFMTKGRTPRLFAIGYDDIRTEYNKKPQAHPYVLLKGTQELSSLAWLDRIKGGKTKDPRRNNIRVPYDSVSVAPTFTDRSFLAIDKNRRLWYLPDNKGKNHIDKEGNLKLEDFGITGHRIGIISSTQYRDERPLLYLTYDDRSLVRCRLRER
ncbi:hypothetical protein J4476_01835 [Candidatus Woesearchaeota archaeon]|nr:MAG: hypothetical protein QT09_C0016G0009 [archaeon GW2011_AR18]MBS3161416.1 hypothetical protein [Candidatus Woesearchaeota archaeon]HIH25875.1 hypothetical protein [Nanoarchaeota archaeon]